MSSAPDPALKPGATYRFVVRSAEEAVQTIRERLGDNAKVLSVRQLPGQGLKGLFGKPQIEVIAQIPENDVRVPARSLAEEELASTRETRGIASHASFSARGAVAGEDTLAARSYRPTVADQPTRLPELLRRSGFSETLIARLQTQPWFASHDDKPLHHALAEIGRQLRRQAGARPAKALPPRSAFIGTAGVGRTTALCKWLAKEVFAHGRMGRVVKAEFDKPNPAEGLAVFCEALGVAVDHSLPARGDDDGAALPPANVETLGGFLYADLPGLSLQSEAENKPIMRFLDREKFEGRILVLNAAYDLSMLRRAYAAGRDLGATHLVFTHLDELEHWGKLWDFLLEGPLTPLFFSTGASLTGDCETSPLDAVLRRTLPGA